MAVYERSVLIEATPAEVFAFHQDPRNIPKISPDSLRVEQVECRVPAVVGEEFRLKVRQFGIPLEWVGFWEEVVPDERLVDGARKSPFRRWRHQHLFRPEGAHCRMTDRVEYLLPGGIIGRLLEKTVMRAVFAIIFSARHKATADYFSFLGG